MGFSSSIISISGLISISTLPLLTPDFCSTQWSGCGFDSGYMHSGSLLSIPFALSTVIVTCHVCTARMQGPAQEQLHTYILNFNALRPPAFPPTILVRKGITFSRLNYLSIRDLDTRALSPYQYTGRRTSPLRSLTRRESQRRKAVKQ